MLLAIDIGNTNVVLGVFDGDRLIKAWRLSTESGRTSDEYGILIGNLYQWSNIPLDATRHIVISCVVPPMLEVFEQLCSDFFHTKPFVIEPGIKTGMAIHYDNPREVGADRIVNAVGAYESYQRSLIVIDFGTATTFDYISPEGEYEGGAIAPGIHISTEALYQRASKLPRVEFLRPRQVVGKNTVASMQSGIILGFVGLIDGIVKRMKEEVRTDPFVVATGGLAQLIAQETEAIDAVDELLILKGLRIIFERNK
jgi:type III pantothenate kinase